MPELCVLEPRVSKFWDLWKGTQGMLSQCHMLSLRPVLVPPQVSSIRFWARQFFQGGAALKGNQPQEMPTLIGGPTRFKRKPSKHRASFRLLR